MQANNSKAIMQTYNNFIKNNKHEVQDFNFNSFDGAVINAIRYSIEYSTSWYVKLLADGYYTYAHGDNTPATVACFYCGQDWTNV